MALISPSSAKQDMSSLVTSSRQLLLVLAPSWECCVGELQRYERLSLVDSWQAVGPVIPVSLGRSGLAWGRGLHTLVDAQGPRKIEGDGCAPAGVFAITALFGYGAAESCTKLAYLRASTDLKAIDDPASVYYNRIVDQSKIAQPDWLSCEDMLRDDQRYAVGAVVGHNTEYPEPAAGSCIFLHVWEHEAAPTAGCTAMSLVNMSELAAWLDGDAQPLLVQLPQMAHEAQLEAWGLAFLR
jgi:L,D-peptidoglycan transpeptidase YkuD (ErfK/YbiS/YcfS/YnhG family)